jgi:hypothetical protein
MNGTSMDQDLPKLTDFILDDSLSDLMTECIKIVHISLFAKSSKRSRYIREYLRARYCPLFVQLRDKRDQIRRQMLKRYGVCRNCVPRCLGGYAQMRSELQRQIAIEQASWNPVIFSSSEQVGHRRSATGTKIRSQARFLHMRGDVVLADAPPEVIGP